LYTYLSPALYQCTGDRIATGAMRSKRTADQIVTQSWYLKEKQVKIPLNFNLYHSAIPFVHVVTFSSVLEQPVCCESILSLRENVNKPCS